MNQVRDILVGAGLRPTRQREIIGKRLFVGTDRHFTAEDLYQEILAGDDRVSLATVYNTLGAFIEVGLLNTVSVDAGRVFYDTNTSPHYHLYNEDGQQLADLHPDGIAVTGLPPLESGEMIDRVDIIVRTRRT